MTQLRTANDRINNNLLPLLIISRDAMKAAIAKKVTHESAMMVRAFLSTNARKQMTIKDNE
jgi:hypothetical protein